MLRNRSIRSLNIYKKFFIYITLLVIVSVCFYLEFKPTETFFNHFLYSKNIINIIQYFENKDDKDYLLKNFDNIRIMLKKTQLINGNYFFYIFKKDTNDYIIVYLNKKNKKAYISKYLNDYLLTDINFDLELNFNKVFELNFNKVKLKLLIKRNTNILFFHFLNPNKIKIVNPDLILKKKYLSDNNTTVIIFNKSLKKGEYLDIEFEDIKKYYLGNNKQGNYISFLLNDTLNPENQINTNINGVIKNNTKFLLFNILKKGYIKILNENKYYISGISNNSILFGISKEKLSEIKINPHLIIKFPPEYKSDFEKIDFNWYVKKLTQITGKSISSPIINFLNYELSSNTSSSNAIQINFDNNVKSNIITDSDLLIEKTIIHELIHTIHIKEKIFFANDFLKEGLVEFIAIKLLSEKYNTNFLLNLENNIDFSKIKYYIDYKHIKEDNLNEYIRYPYNKGSAFFFWLYKKDKNILKKIFNSKNKVLSLEDLKKMIIYK